MNVGHVPTSPLNNSIVASLQMYEHKLLHREARRQTHAVHPQEGEGRRPKSISPGVPFPIYLAKSCVHSAGSTVDTPLGE